MKVGIGFTPGFFVILGAIFLQYVSAQGQKIRLGGDSEPLQGRVEIQQNGQWGTVCIDDGWDVAEATVVCRQLGLPYAQALSTTSARLHHVSPGWSLDILLSSVRCSGQEDSLAECQSQPPGEDTGCTHYDDVVVTCALPGFRGCYANVPEVWIEQRSHQPQLTINSCLDVCRRSGFLIGAMSEGEFCWCGNNGTIAGGLQLSPQQCDAACVGNDKQFCGGTDEETSFYTTNIGGAYITDPKIYNPRSGMIASPSFPGDYSTSMTWQLDFPSWVTIEVRLPFFNLPTQDLLVFTNRENGIPLEVLSGDGGASVYFVIGPLKALDVSLQDNGVPGDTDNTLGFLLIYQVSPAASPTRPPAPGPTTTMRPTTTTDAPTTTRPTPPPPPPTTLPPPPRTTLPQAPTTTTPPPEPTRAKTTTAQLPTTTRPKTTTAESTTTRRPPPPTTKATTTKKKTTTAKSTEPPPPSPVRTSRPPVRSTTAKSATDGDVSRRRLVDWWFEFWTFICVGVFVVGIVSICLICWKSGQWKCLKRSRRRHHVIHRRHSSHSSWSDHYNFSLGDEYGYQHKHRRNSDGSSQSSHSAKQHHRRHRRHSSHSSWSSTWAPSTPSRRSLSSSSQSSHSLYRNESTQHLIDPNNHSYPGVIYHEGYPGRPPVAYPIIYDPTPSPHDPAMPPHDPMASQDPIPLDPIPPLDPMPLQYPIPPQDSVLDIDPMSEDPPTLPLDSPQDFPPTSPPETYIMPESHPAPPPAPPPPPSLTVDPMRIPEAGPMHVFEDECGPSDFDNRPIDPVVLVATGPPPASPENDLIIPEVEPYIVAENTGSGNHIKKSKKSKQKRSTSSSNNKESDKTFKLFGFGKSKNKEPQHPIVAQYIAEEPPVELMHVIEDECRPNEFNDGPFDPQPAIATASPTASPDGDLIVPEVEPYIVAENTKFTSPIAESAVQKKKSGKRSKIFGFGKSRKKSSSYQFSAGPVAEEQYGEAGAIADPEIEAVISGLDQSIQQAEIEHGTTGTSISVDSEAAYNRGPDGFDNPVYGSSSAMGTFDEAGNRQHVNAIASNGGTPLPDVDDVFVVVQSSDGNRIEFIQSENEEIPTNFILPGEGTDEIPDDLLDMFDDGDNYIPPPPLDPPPPPPE